MTIKKENISPFYFFGFMDGVVILCFRRHMRTFYLSLELDYGSSMNPVWIRELRFLYDVENKVITAG